MSILCIVFYYEYQYQAFPGLIRRVFIIQFVTVSHGSSLRCYLNCILTLEHPKLTPEHFYQGTFQADPGTKNFSRWAQLFCSQVGPKLQSAPDLSCSFLSLIQIKVMLTPVRLH